MGFGAENEEQGEMSTASSMNEPQSEELKTGMQKSLSRPRQASLGRDSCQARPLKAAVPAVSAQSHVGRLSLLLWANHPQYLGKVLTRHGTFTAPLSGPGTPCRFSRPPWRLPGH
jgi:hypothetical protein